MSEQVENFSNLTKQKDRDFWKQKLAGNLSMIDLPSDRPRQLTEATNYRHYSFELNQEIIDKLEQFSTRKDISVELILLVTFQVFLYRYTQQEDLILATVGLNENSSNLIILRTDIAEDLSFNNFLELVKANVSDALAHENYSLRSLIAELLPESGLEHFKVWYEVKNSLNTFDDRESFDLSLIRNSQAKSAIAFKYNSDLFEADTIALWANHWQTLLFNALATPELAIDKLPLLTEREKNQLLFDWNQTQVEYPTAKNIYQLFEERVKENPNAIAVIFEEQQLTYQELNQKANQLARYLQTVGVKPEVLVGICLERSLEMVIGLLGILKAGGAYVPIDPHYPESRLSYMLEDSQVKVLLSQKSVALTLPPHKAEVICLDADWHLVAAYDEDNLELAIDAENLAYVIYTSGSTGKPKGVMNSHRGILNRLQWMQEMYQLTPGDRVLQKTPFSFDVSVWEFFWTLMTGATMVVAKPEGHKDSNYLADLINRQQVTTMHFVPSMLQVFLQESNLERCKSLKRVFCSGEALPFELTKRFFERLDCQLHNLYGPTEAAIDVTYWECQPNDDLQVVPIGCPIANTQTYILDKYLQPVPVGVLGELYLGGTNLARGYLNRPKLTAERFIGNPFVEANNCSPLLYKTGDLARYRQDKNIEFLGRIDHQVKLRGFRIELGEIEATLDTHPQIQQAVVLATDDLTGNKRLVAYLASDESLKTSELREFLGTKLPEYMIPSLFVTLDEIPLTPNGKVDRRALPAPDLRQEMEKSYQAPSTTEEKLIADIWQEVLSLEKVGVEDNFFELGGNSLLAMQTVSRLCQLLSVDLTLNSLFDAPTIKELTREIDSLRQGHSNRDLIKPIDRNGILPLSSLERSLWFVERMHPESCVYNIPLTIELEGVVEIEILEQSLNIIIQRHEILRTSYSEINGQPQKKIVPELSLELPLVEIATIEAEQIASQEASQPFDLGKDTLIRAKLLRLSDDRFWLLITCHHIVFDGWSIQVLFDELVENYRALSQEGTPSLPELTIQYTDYAGWQQRWLQSSRYSQQLDYWRSQLAEADPLIELPTDRPRPTVQTYKGDRIYFELDNNLTQALNSLSRQSGVTLYMTLLAAFKVLLYRYTGQQDIIVGSPFANRHDPDIEPLIGFLVNTVVLRTNLTGELSFTELLSRVRTTTSGAYANADLPFDKLVEELQPSRDLSYNPLFQVMFALQKQLPTTQTNADLAWSMVEPGSRNCSMFDLTLDLVETATGIEGHFEYNSDLFDRATIARAIAHWQTLLAGIVANPQTSVAKLPLLTNPELQTLTDWNQNISKPYQSIGKLFATQVELNPDAVAIVFQDQQLTYQQLDLRVNQLAHYLQSLGVTAETLVGICIERSIETIVGLLAILKAGGAYVPLDPAYPTERLAYMVEDAQISVLLTETKWLDKIPSHQARVVNLDAEQFTIAKYSTKKPIDNATDKNLAYVIYTSGSTGKPKGVAITQQALSSFTRTAIAEYKITQSDRILQFASINFDAAVEEIFPCLCTGATLVLRTEEMLALPNLLKACEEFKLTILDLPTAYWHQLVAELKEHSLNLPESLRLVIIGGEAVLPEPVKQWQELVTKFCRQDSLELINTYGPTEATVVATSYKIPNTPIIGEVPIGRPLSHLQTCILDSDRALVPVGVPGELYIGGDALARGYLNRPELTEEKFISILGDRFYQTGDKARYLRNGDIEYLGRIDNQVKLRGFRIELGEIESALTQHPSINEAAVIVRQDSSNKSLVAYIVSQSELSSQEVRAFLQDKLPNYMMPNAYVFLEAMPLTPSNKLDRKALPSPDLSRSEVEIALPTNEVETKLVTIWSQVLDIQSIGITDNFFELGGHSLLALKLVAAIESQFKIELPATILFETPTIQQLAVGLQTDSKTKFHSIVKLKAGNGTPLFLVHDADGETILYGNLANHLKPDQAVYAIRPKQQTPTRISEIVSDYIAEIRQIQPQGSYFIGGFCAGGVIAYEIACQLQAQGESVPLLAIIDAINPQGIGNNYVGVSEDRRKSFIQALNLQESSAIAIFKTACSKIINLINYEVRNRSTKLTDNLRVKLLRYCCDRNLPIPKFCQNIPLRTVYTYAEADYIKDKQSRYQGKLTLWRATEKQDLSNPAIDDTPAIWEVTDPLLGWGDAATEGVDAHDIPGGHSSMLQNPNVKVMAKKLQHYMNG